MEEDRNQPLVRHQSQEASDSKCEHSGILHSSQEGLKHHLKVCRKGNDRDISTASDTQDDNQQSGTLPHAETTEGEVNLSQFFGFDEEMALICPLEHSIFSFHEDETRDEPFTNTESMQLKDEQNLNVQLGVYTDGRSYKYCDCGRMYRCDRLKVRRRTHTEEKSFACPECGKKFAKKSSLNIHLRRHTGEKPYACHLCGKKFARNSSMKKHQRRMFFKCGLNV